MTLLQRIFKNVDTPQTVIARVSEEVKLGSMYVFLICAATVLAVFGIATANTAVVIGSMIIAPLSWPIMGIAVGIASEKSQIIVRSCINVLVSIILVVLFSYILSVGFLSSTLTLNAEILSRTTPTLYDLIIALAVGFVAAVSLSWPKVSETVAGVAIASSLLPPLTVTGMGLAMGNSEVISGSFVLFVTNMLSIIFTGLILFLLQGYYKASKETHVGFLTISFGITVVSIIALGLHLSLSLSSLIEQRSTVLNAEHTLQRELLKISPGLQIDQSYIRKEQTASGTLMRIQANVTSPQDISITSTQKNSLVEMIKQSVGIPVDVDLRFIPSLKVISDDALMKDKLQSQIYAVEKQVDTYFQVLNPAITVDTVRVHIGEEDSKAQVSVIIKTPEGVRVGMEQTVQLQNALRIVLDKETSVEIQVLNTYTVTDENNRTEYERVQSHVATKTEEFMERMLVAWQMNIVVTDISPLSGSYVISAIVYTGNDVNIDDKLEYYKKTLLENTDLLTEDTIDLRFQVIQTNPLQL